ncbi:MAG TPA: metalloregulator ArsR/SmtB family transcription factor [Patescibacteria group bacterium]|nr:metalloregulator ArsR/SmtB family transcription factor [Patescibacteria group bacterium]
MSALNNSKLKTLTKLLQTASEPNRLKILCFIFKTERACVSEIAKGLKLGVATTSHHLQSLNEAGLLTPEREGKKICYGLVKTNLINDLKNLICKYK